MPNQAHILPQTLTEKMYAGYAKKTKGGSSGAVITTSSTTATTITTEQVKAKVITDIDIALIFAQTIDGVYIDNGEIAVVNGQVDATQNGIYIVRDGAWVRHPQPLYGGLTIAVTQGSKYHDTYWLVAEPDYKVTIDTDKVVFAEITATQAIEQIYVQMNRLFAINLESLSCAVCSLKAEIAERNYEVVCYVDTLPVPFTAIDNTTTPIPFSNLLFAPFEGSYNALLGTYVPVRQGYYHVDVFFFATNLPAHNDQIWLEIISGSGGGGKVDSVVLNAGLCYMNGSVVVYYGGVGGISANIRTGNHGYNIVFGRLAAPELGGFMSVHYCGSTRSAINNF